MNPGWERELAACRANLASDPDAASVRASQLLKDARTNSQRVRATLTLAGIEKARGRLEKYREMLEEAARYHRPGRLAQSELAGRWAQLHLYEADLDAALAAANRAVELAEPEASAAPRHKRTYRAQAVVPKAAYAAALITRGDVRLRLRSLPEALSDAITALSYVDPRFSRHVHVAGLSLLGTVLVEPGIATPNLAHHVLKICRDGHRILAAHRIKARDPHRIMLRGLNALALGVLGSIEKAESLLLRTIQEFKDAGRERDAEVFMTHMIWLIGYRAGQIGRARILAAQYGLPAGTVPNLPAPMPVKDEPIGF